MKKRNRQTKILIVDDEAFNLMAGKFILKAAGIENVETMCETATNGLIAVDMIKQNVRENGEAKFDLILMD